MQKNEDKSVKEYKKKFPEFYKIINEELNNINDKLFVKDYENRFLKTIKSYNVNQEEKHKEYQFILLREIKGYKLKEEKLNNFCSFYYLNSENFDFSDNSTIDLKEKDPTELAIYLLKFAIKTKNAKIANIIIQDTPYNKIELNDSLKEVECFLEEESEKDYFQSAKNNWDKMSLKEKEEFITSFHEARVEKYNKDNDSNENIDLEFKDLKERCSGTCDILSKKIYFNINSLKELDFSHNIKTYMHEMDGHALGQSVALENVEGNKRRNNLILYALCNLAEKQLNVKVKYNRYNFSEVIPCSIGSFVETNFKEGINKEFLKFAENQVTKTALSIHEKGENSSSLEEKEKISSSDCLSKVDIINRKLKKVEETKNLKELMDIIGQNEKVLNKDKRAILSI